MAKTGKWCAQRSQKPPTHFVSIHPFIECYKIFTNPEDFIKLIAKFILEGFKPYQAILENLSLKNPS